MNPRWCAAPRGGRTGPLTRWMQSGDPLVREVSRETLETNPGTIPACPGHCGCGGVRGGLCARGGAVCCLVLQAPVGRLGEPDSEPTGGVAGLDTPPPGLPTCRRLPTTANGRGWPSPTHDWGRSALPDCTGTGGAALGWTSLPR